MGEVGDSGTELKMGLKSVCQYIKFIIKLKTDIAHARK